MKDVKDILDEAQEKMDMAVMYLEESLAHIRAGKADVRLLDGIRAAVSPETEVLYERGCNFLGQALHPFDPSMLRDENGESGLTGHYYNGPVPQGEPVQVRTDRTVNFNWIFALPHPALDANCFSVVWTGSVVMPLSLIHI